MSKQTSVSKKSFPIGRVLYVGIVIALLVFSGFMLYKYLDINNKYQLATQSEEERNRQLVTEVSKLYNIPSFETEKPSVYIVTDPEQLKDNEFFKDSQKDDALLAYPTADIAVLYRPGEKKIINTASYKETFASSVEVAIIAPTSSQANLEEALKAKFSNIVVISKAEAKTPINTGVVVDVTGEESEAAKTLADLLKFTVGTLPAGESAPEGAKLIIIAPNTTPTP